MVNTEKHHVDIQDVYPHDEHCFPIIKEHKTHIFEPVRRNNIFFIFNHHNYARWIIIFIYISNMIQAKETNPQFLEEFQRESKGQALNCQGLLLI